MEESSVLFAELRRQKGFRYAPELLARVGVFIRASRKSGRTWRAIQEELGLPKETVRRWSDLPVESRKLQPVRASATSSHARGEREPVPGDLLGPCLSRVPGGVVLRHPQCDKASSPTRADARLIALTDHRDSTVARPGRRRAARHHRVRAAGSRRAVRSRRDITVSRGGDRHRLRVLPGMPLFGFAGAYHSEGRSRADLVRPRSFASQISAPPLVDDATCIASSRRTRPPTRAHRDHRTNSTRERLSGRAWFTRETAGTRRSSDNRLRAGAPLSVAPRELLRLRGLTSAPRRRTSLLVLSHDPLGYVDSYNLYAYAAMDPINFWDPYGLGAGGFADTGFGDNPKCEGCFNVDGVGGGLRAGTRAVERGAHVVGDSNRAATEYARTTHRRGTSECRGASCIAPHAGAFLTEVYAGTTPQSGDDVMFDIAVGIGSGGLGLLGEKSTMPCPARRGWTISPSSSTMCLAPRAWTSHRLQGR